MSEEKHTTDTGDQAVQDSPEQDLHDPLMREKDEPKQGRSPIPIFILFLFAALCFWGGVYLIQYSGGFSRNAYSPDYNPHAVATVVEVPLYERGAKVFKSQCVACHQATGLGVPGIYPPLAGSEWVTGHQESLARILINGINGPLEVAGKSYNGNMPAFGPSGLNLKAKEIAAVLTYIRQDWGNAASDINEATMNGYLDQYGSRGTPWTASEVVEGLSAEAAPVVLNTAAEDANAPAAAH
jgi:mono/diheme cytochrome c family protein